MTLNDLAASLNGVAGVNATIDASGRLKISTTDADSTLSFGQDSSGVLAALGINTFFKGVDADSIGVEDQLATDPTRLAAGLTGQSGDGQNAQNLADLANTQIGTLGNLSLPEFQQKINSDLAEWTASAKDTASASSVVHDSLQSQNDSLSGVSLDEEAVNMMQYQRLPGRGQVHNRRGSDAPDAAGHGLLMDKTQCHTLE